MTSQVSQICKVYSHLTTLTKFSEFFPAISRIASGNKIITVNIRRDIPGYKVKSVIIYHQAVGIVNDSVLIYITESSIGYRNLEVIHSPDLWEVPALIKIRFSNN